MIRKYEATDADSVVKIWLEASAIAHDFMPLEFWQNKTDDLRKIYLPSAITYVYQDDNSPKIFGFISMVDNFIAALFVLPAEQGKGIGKQLIDYIKPQYDTIGLAVFKENEAAIAFYKKQGFKILSENIEESTGHAELTMIFSPLSSSE